jgi:low affinity Fe/Cu permease
LPVAALAVVASLVTAVCVGVVLGVPPSWVTAFEVGTSCLTVTMVFVIQHTQGGEQAATQRKLDELLRALPEAESGLMLLEEAPDDVLRNVEMGQRQSGTTPSGPVASRW